MVAGSNNVNNKTLSKLILNTYSSLLIEVQTIQISILEYYLYYIIRNCNEIRIVS